MSQMKSFNTGMNSFQSENSYDLSVKSDISPNDSLNRSHSHNNNNNSKAFSLNSKCTLL